MTDYGLTGIGPDDDPEAIDLDQLYRDQDPRRISLESRQKMAAQTGLTLAQLDGFLGHVGQAWAEIDTEEQP